ncbi:MAG: YHS domain-containing (seleno)protein [Myxococcota bacterium]
MSRSSRSRRARWGAPLAALALAIGLALPGTALALDPINATFFGNAAIEGTDPVAYFTEGRPVEGSKAHTFEYMGATWRFASAENKAAFEAAPEKYAPQYGGYCAWAVSQGYTAGIDPEAWTIVDGKLYLNYSEKVMKTWLADRDAFIEAADDNWPGLRDE